MNRNSCRLADIYQHFACSSIKLTSHDLRSKLKNCHLFFQFPEFPGSLQSKYAAANYDCMIHALQHRLNFLNIRHTADRDHTFSVCSRNWRNKALGTESVNQFCIFQFFAVRKLHFFFFLMDSFYFFSENLVNVVFFIPAFFFHCNFLRFESCSKSLCKHRTVVCGIRLVGDHNYGTGKVTLTDCLCSA